MSSTSEQHAAGTPEIRDPVQMLGARFLAAIAAAYPQAGDCDALIAPCRDAAMGDFQCNAAMPLAKKVGAKPRDVAAKIVQHVDVSDIAEALTEASIAGPGFINIRLRSDAIAGMLATVNSDGLGVQKEAQQTIVVDLMGVNLAKQMHVGHLRSPIIGDALARLFERMGHRVIRQNHVGDWGLPIAMVTDRLMRLEAAGQIRLDRLTLDELDTAYKTAQLECQRDMDGLKAVTRFGLGPKAQAELEEQVAGATEAFTRARETLVRLQQKEAGPYAVWKRIYEVTMKVCLEVCATLRVAVTEEANAGESSYADELAPMIADLEARGIAEKDAGALVVRLDTTEFGNIKEPCLIRKTDGGYLYATTDVCAVRRRVQKFGAHRLVYAIDARQALHMRQIFGASIKAGYGINRETGLPARMDHAAFGSVLGEDGRPFKTRAGESVKLADLIEETFGRAARAVQERSPDLSAAQARSVAEAVGVAALKYADLSTDRIKDYLFGFDRMLAFEGNTGPYLLYAYVRVCRIFVKAAEQGVGDGWKRAGFAPVHSAEKMLALAILRYPGVLRSTADTLEPHKLCGYLYELASAYSSFYDLCPVLAAGDAETRDARLKLCDLTGRVLADGLGVLGIPTVDRM